MREIKFRAWDKEFKEMNYPLLFEFENGIQSDNEEAVIMQYTGLKDKNGKESYIGDICKDNEGEIFYIEQDTVLIYGKYSTTRRVTMPYEL